MKCKWTSNKRCSACELHFTDIAIPKPTQQLYMPRIPHEAFGDEKFDTRKSPNTVKQSTQMSMNFQGKTKFDPLL